MSVRPADKRATCVTTRAGNYSRTQHTPLKVFPASLLVVTIQKVAMTSILMGFIRFIHIMCVCSLLDLCYYFMQKLHSASTLYMIFVHMCNLHLSCTYYLCKSTFYLHFAYIFCAYVHSVRILHTIFSHACGIHLHVCSP